MNYLQELNAFRDWSLLNRPTTSEIVLWYSLMSINNMAGWRAWFTAANQTVQLMTGLSKASLDRARNKLVQKGLIEYETGTTRQAGSYRLVSFCDQKRDQCETNAGPMPDQYRTNPETINKLNKTKQKESIPPEVKKPRSPFKSLKQQERFDEWYSQYPKKMSKGSAEKAWANIAPDDLLFKRIMVGLETSRASPKWAEEHGKYIPYPATWLNRKCWEDEHRGIGVVSTNVLTDSMGRPI